MERRTMELDNPSYFAMGNAESSASECSLSRQATPPRYKRSFRSFLRSVSTTSADSYIMGEPRESGDVAPDLMARRPCPPASEEDEVFLGEETARYCGRRRHSVGAASSRDRTDSIGSSTHSFRAVVHATSDGESVGGTVAEAVAAAAATTPVNDVDEHSLRHASYPRRRCVKCMKGITPKPINMHDILIVSLKRSEAATLWVEYFTSYFQQISKQANRKPFKIQYLSVEEPTQDAAPAEKTAVKLQLVVLCPSLLEFIADNPDTCTVTLGNLFLSDRTLALLLGVSDADLTETHKKVLPTYHSWQRMSAGQDQDENFTREFLGQAMAILSRVWKQQSSVSAQEKTPFSVSPKKIRQGQNSVFILLAYPLQKEDILKVSIERNNEIYEVKSVKRRNPYTVKISVPDNLTEVTAIVNILVEKNGNIVGSRPIKCESKLRELEQILRSTDNPVEFMCQTLGFNPTNKDQLDNWLLHAFQRNLPAHFSLLANHTTPFAAAIYTHKHSHEEYPTLLHFAAKFGLEKLAMQLLDCPGADVAYDIRNVFDMTPAEMAETNGHTELANLLRGYMKMNEFSSMYTKLKEMSLKTKNSDGDGGYLTPKTMEEFYKICPAPRPVEFMTPVSDCSTPSGYMAMTIPAVKANEEDELEEIPEEVEELMPLQPKEDRTEPAKNCTFAEDKVQKELMEIINDFKNNVHSIGQVEKLVDEWKNRNDVQKSFQEKQQQLSEMRAKYDKIQQEMKLSMKKSTPFERVKKLFSRNKAREESKNEMVGGSVVGVQSQRPISSLSTSSSGSSGRMSTISGSSLGDSGTHSDNEERKNILGTHDEDFRNELNKAVLELNYTPVPAPKPVIPGLLKTKFFETIEEKPAQRPDTLPINEEYYIQFPPSGLPVQGTNEQDKTINNNQYININVNEQMNGSREYMNFKVVTNR